MTFKKITSLILTTLLLCTILVVTAPETAEATVVIPIVDADCGYNHTIALHSDGTVWTWGYNGYGQLGDDTLGIRNIPGQVPGLPNIIAVDAEGCSNVVLDSYGNVWTWGWNNCGQLGDGTTTDNNTPQIVITGVTDISSSFNHVLAVKSDGTVWAWGDNGTSQLGDSTTIDSSVPIQVTGITDAVSVEAARGCSFVIKSDGTVWGWGNNTQGQLGIGTSSSNPQIIPAQMNNISDAIQVSCNTGHTLVLESDGTVWAMGPTRYGVLGDGRISFNTYQTTPIQVQGLTNIIDIGTGYYHSMALSNDGTVWTWGSNNLHQLGYVASYSAYPTEVDSLSGTMIIAAGYSTSLSIQNDGYIWMWGANSSGQLGDGTLSSTYYPRQVLNLNLFY